MYYIPEDPDDEDEEEKLPELDFDEAGLGEIIETESQGEQSDIDAPVILI